MRVMSVIAAIIAAVAIGVGISMVDINQTEEANLPVFDVDLVDTKNGTQEVTLDVPTIEFQTPAVNGADDS